MQDFKRIKAWQRAHALAVKLQKASRNWGRAGHAHLRSQLTRAAESIAANIVEGCGAASRKDFARFLDMSIKSATETEYHLISAKSHELFSQKEWERFNAETIEIRKMTYGYRKKILEEDRDAKG